MKLLVTALFLVTTLAVATQAPPQITRHDAKKFVGKDVTICGRVVDYGCTHSKDMALLNIDERRTNNVSVGIPSASTSEFGERIVDRYLGANVCATGRLERVEKRYVAVVDAPSSITLPGPNAPSPDIFAPGAIRMCSPDVQEPKLLREVEAHYTAAATWAGIQGVLVMEAVVLPDGTVGDVRVIQSVDRKYGLDQQGVAALRQWRFRPGTLRGQIVPMIVTVELTFALR
jgi:TonB family protein